MTNLGTRFDLDIDEEKKFRHCFFAFGGSLEGFKHCRPMLMLDGTFLKGKHKGILLSAVGKDGNEGTYVAICLHVHLVFLSLYFVYY